MIIVIMKIAGVVVVLTTKDLLNTVVLEGSESCRQGFFPGAPVSSPLSSVNGSANKTKLK